MYEIHIFELRNEEINVKKILAVINATYAVAKRKPEKHQGSNPGKPSTPILISLQYGQTGRKNLLRGSILHARS